jgi:hypothetical protein
MTDLAFCTRTPRSRPDERGKASRRAFTARREAGGSRRPFDHPGKASGRERGSPLADEDKRRRLTLPLEPAQGPEFVTVEWMGAGSAVLDPPSHGLRW